MWTRVLRKERPQFNVAVSRLYISTLGLYVIPSLIERELFFCDDDGADDAGMLCAFTSLVKENEI